MKKRLNRVLSLLVTLAMLIVFAVPIFAEGASTDTFVFTSTSGNPLPLNSSGRLVLSTSATQTQKCQIKKDGTTINDLGDIQTSVKSSNETVATIKTDGPNKNTFVINLLTAGDAEITYKNGADTAVLPITVTTNPISKYSFAENSNTSIWLYSITISGNFPKNFQMEEFDNKGNHQGNSQGFNLSVGSKNTVLSAEPSVSLSVSHDGYVLTVTPIKNGLTTITYTDVEGKTATLDVTVTDFSQPTNKEVTIDDGYIGKLKSKNFGDIFSLFVILPENTTIDPDSTGTVKAVKMPAKYSRGENSYLLLPIKNPAVDTKVTLAVSDGTEITVIVKPNLSKYILALLNNTDGTFDPTLGISYEFGNPPQNLDINLFSNIENPSYELVPSNNPQLSVDFALNGSQVKGTTDTGKYGYGKLMGVFSICDKSDMETYTQFTVNGSFKDVGSEGNPYHKNGDNQNVYWSESLTQISGNSATLLFTVGKMNSAYNKFWSDQTNPNDVYNNDVKEVKYEIPSVYDNLNLELSNGGVATKGSHTVFGKTFNDIYGITVTSSIPTEWKNIVYLKQTVTYKNGTTSNPQPQRGPFNNPYVSYVPLGSEITNPPNTEIDLSAPENSSMTIQEAILKGGEGVTVILEPNKTYTENVTVPFYARIQGREESVIKAPAGGKPVITVTSYMRPVEIYNVTIDGNSENSVGIETKGGGFVALGDLNAPEGKGCIVQNCSTGVRVPRDGGITDCTITNNKIGMEFFQELGYGMVKGNTVEGNETGVKFSTGYEPSTYGSFEAQHNVVKGNRLNNLDADGISNAEFRNNFLELGAGDAPDMDKIIGNPLIHPYFTTETMDTVLANVDKLTVNASNQREIPYIANKVEDNKAPTIGAKVFEDIMAPSQGRAVPSQKPTLVQGFVYGEVAYSFLINEVKKAIAFNTRYDANVAKPSIIANSAAKNGRNRPVSFKHNGELPGQTVVTLRDESGKYRAGETLYLYWLNPTTNKLQLSGRVTVTETNGMIYLTFTMDHCSDYLITDVNVDNSGTTSPPSYGNGGYSGSGSSSSSDVIYGDAVYDAFQKAENGLASLDISTSPLLAPQGFWELQRNANISLLLKGDGYSWSFKGSDISLSKIPNGEFNTQISKISPNATQIKNAAGDAKYENIYFAHHGILPGKAVIKVQTGFKSETVNLYYFDSITKKLVYYGKAEVNASGVASFTITHCSDYILSKTIIANAVSNPLGEVKASQVPKTGVDESENSSTGFAAMILGGILAGISVFILKKRRVIK